MRLRTRGRFWSVTTLTSLLAVTTPAAADSLVMSFRSDDAFGRIETHRGFAKHYGSGGVLILPDHEAVPQTAAVDASDFSAPAPVQPRGEVLRAIHETALRYAGDPILRSVEMSVTDWVFFFQANVEIESAYNQTAVSKVGAVGLGQLMPDTASALGVDPRNIHQNLDGSARYLLMLMRKFGSPELALAGYNAGPGAVEKYQGIPPYRETVGHVAKVMAAFNRLKGESA